MGSIPTDFPGGGEPTEDIIAEPDEAPEGYISIIVNFFILYKWYIFGIIIALYVYFKNSLPRIRPTLVGSTSSSTASSKPKTPQEIQAWQQKEEARLKAVERLQQRYAEEAARKAERQKQLDEEKRLAKLKEKEKLAGKVDLGNKVGGGDGSDTSKKSLRPEYNPLMGDAGSSGRVCFRRPGGGGGGG